MIFNFECLIFDWRRAPATGGGIGIYFMKSGIDRHEVRSESGFVVSLEFGESGE